MKHTIQKIFISALLLLFAAGCGREEGDTISDNMALGNTSGAVLDITGGLSGDMAGVSADSVSGNLSGNMASGAVLAEPVSGVAGASGSVSSNDLLAGLGVHSNCIYIANMSGKDIAVLTLTFSEGEIRGGEILGGEVLKDGELFTYTAADINALQEATGLRLTVTATAKDDTVMSFPEVRVINPSGCTVVLSRGQSTSENQAGYEAYIE